jgi:predicted ATP-grasp superfamily ATP-dependent carboligase
VTVLAVAAVSARMLAEAAARDGYEVIALDLFGDVDTCRAAARWLAIGTPERLRIDADALLAALGVLARRGNVAGWIAGAGLESSPELLAEAGRVLPLIATAPDAVRQVRDPETFFAALGTLGIPAPAVQRSLPDDPSGWLVKDPRGQGGWHIRRAPPAGDASLPAHHYAQREVHGVPMSATFLANGTDAVVLGFNEMIVRPVGDRPFVYCGAIGPVPVAPEIGRAVVRAVRALAEAFSLKGLGSVDFMLDGERFHVLEVNPRPPASMALYAGLPLVAAHVDACRHARLPDWPDPLTSPAAHDVEGVEIVYARRPFALAEGVARRLADAPHVHDVACAGTRFRAGDPVCSVEAHAATGAETRARLAEGRESLLGVLESCP